MTLQELAQIGGIVGVIASLIYVAIQIRNNSRAVRAATFQQISHTMQAALFSVASNEEIVSLILRGGDNFSSLSRIEKARFRFHGMFVLSINQNIYFQHQIGTLTEADWDSFKRDLVSYFDMKGAREAWPLYKGRFSPEFVAYVDAIVEGHNDQEISVPHPFGTAAPQKKPPKPGVRLSRTAGRTKHRPTKQGSA